MPKLNLDLRPLDIDHEGLDGNVLALEFIKKGSPLPQERGISITAPISPRHSLHVLCRCSSVTSSLPALHTGTVATDLDLAPASMLAHGLFPKSHPPFYSVYTPSAVNHAKHRHQCLFFSMSTTL